MQQIRKDAIITFIKNSDKENKEFGLNDEIFSMPYSKILQAEQFCETEELDYCYVGFKNFLWHIGIQTEGRHPLIKVTKDGIAPEVIEEFIIDITEV